MSNYSSNNYTGSKNTTLTRCFDLVSEKSTVLDVGCSSGNFGRALSEMKGCTVDGVEMNPKDVAKARKHLRTVYEGSVEDQLENITGKYDYITFCDVLEHLVHPEDVLRSIKGLLAPGGVVVFSIPNMAHASVRLNLLRGIFDYGKTGLLDWTHLHFYTKKEILRVFDDAGYAVSELQYTEVDYNDNILKSELKELGITYNETLGALLKDETAVAHGYIGIANPTTKSQRIGARPVSAPDPEYLYSKYYAEKEKYSQEKIKQLEDANVDLTKQIAKLSKSGSWGYVKSRVAGTQAYRRLRKIVK